MTQTTLIQVLERSVEKHGADKELTLGHLLNILKLAKRVEEERYEKQEEQDIINESKWEIF